MVKYGCSPRLECTWPSKFHDYYMIEQTDASHSKSLGQTVRERTRPTDLGILLFVPAVLVVMFALPAEIRLALDFEYADPSVLTAFTSAFVHRSPAHLLVNLVLYLLVVPTSFVLSVSSGSRRRFYTIFVTFLLVFPLMLSYLNLAVLRPAVALGFSGIVMAFVGYLPIALADYLDVNFDIGPQTASAPALFFFSLALVSLLSVRSVVPSNGTVLLGTIGLALAATLSALLYASQVVERADTVWSEIRSAVESPGYLDLLLFAVVLFLALLFVAFPADPTVDGGTLNLYTHFLGYALGFMTTYVTVETAGRLGPRPSGL
jgi:membrane associated rhomboid family serine protease